MKDWIHCFEDYSQWKFQVVNTFSYINRAKQQGCLHKSQTIVTIIHYTGPWPFSPSWNKNMTLVDIYYQKDKCKVEG